MKKKLTTVAFRGTPEQEEKLIAIIEKYNGIAGALMPILQEAQELYGYLPVEVQAIISRETGISMSEIYGVVTFYAQFNLNPKGKYNIAVCLGTACYVKGAGDVIVTTACSLAALTLRVSLAYLCVYAFGMGCEAVWVVMPVGWTAAGTIALTRYLRGRWKTKGIVKHE